MKPTLEDIRTARDSARQRRDHNAKRLKRLILRLITRVEAYEHEMSLLTRVERDAIAHGKADWELPALFSTPAGRTETRFDGGASREAVLILEGEQSASSAIRRATPMPVDQRAAQKGAVGMAAPIPGGPPPANLPAAGEVF